MGIEGKRSRGDTVEDGPYSSVARTHTPTSPTTTEVETMCACATSATAEAVTADDIIDDVENSNDDLVIVESQCYDYRRHSQVYLQSQWWRQ